MNRSWRAGVALVFITSSASSASALPGALTEADVIQIFLDESPQTRRAAVVERSVDAALHHEIHVDSPDLGYQLEEAAGTRDEFLTLRQEIPISGRRRLLEKRSAAAASAAGIGADRDLRGALYELKRLFHEILYRERVLDAFGNQDELLEGTVEILRLREREGEGAGYDVLRAEQELAKLRMTTAEAELSLAAARSRFGSFFAGDRGMESVSLGGDLTPEGPIPESSEATARALEQRLDLRALAGERTRWDLERRAARRLRFPEPVITAGWKRTEADGFRDSGYLAAISVPLPLFRPGHAASLRAAAEAERIELDEELLRRRIRAEVRAALERERTLRDVAGRYGEPTEARARELTRIARLKYDEGESGILELLDAHHSALTMRLRALSARYEAKIAEIDRNRVIGNEVIP